MYTPARTLQRIALVALAAFVLSGAAQAASPCTDAGSADAKAPEFGSKAAEIVAGSLVSFLLGLTPATFPADEISKIPNACQRTTFTVGSDVYTVHGANGDQPSRFATSPTQSGIAFFAAMPRPQPALEWHRRYMADNNVAPNFNTERDMMFALVVTRGSKRDVYEFYDKIPDDERVASAMCQALAGKLPIFATFDVETSDFEFSPKPPTQALECRMP